MNTFRKSCVLVRETYYSLESKARRFADITSVTHKGENKAAEIEELCKDKHQFYRVIHFFGLVPGKTKDHTRDIIHAKTYEISDTMKLMLRDFDVALCFASNQEIFIRARFNHILSLSISTVKKREASKLNILLPSDNGYNPHQDPLASIVVTHDQKIRMPFFVKGMKRWMRGIMPYVLWYGQREQLETNLIAVWATHLGGIDLSTLFCYMGMIHRARKRAGRNAALYGIYTDTYEWVFVYLDNKSRYTTKVLNWSSGQQEIFTHLDRIISNAIFLMQTESKHGSDGQTASSLAQCSISEVNWEDEVDDLNLDVDH